MSVYLKLSWNAQRILKQNQKLLHASMLSKQLIFNTSKIEKCIKLKRSDNAVNQGLELKDTCGSYLSMDIARISKIVKLKLSGNGNWDVELN